MRTRLPLAVVALASLGAAFVLLPVLALFVRAPWTRLGGALSGVGASTARPAAAVIVLLSMLSSTFWE